MKKSGETKATDKTEHNATDEAPTTTASVDDSTVETVKQFWMFIYDGISLKWKLFKTNSCVSTECINIKSKQIFKNNLYKVNISI